MVEGALRAVNLRYPIVLTDEAVAEVVMPRQSYIVPAQAGTHSAEASRFTQAKSLNVRF